MEDLFFVFRHFFTHKDFLPSPAEIPGTLFTPMHLMVEAVLLALILGAAVYVAHRKALIRPVFTGLLISLVIFEIAIDAWDSMAGAVRGFDVSVSLPLYPCSLFMYVLPFVIWGKGKWRQMGCGYICTLGLAGALINFLYPTARLTDYSVISFPAFHTFYYHGTMLFAALTLLLSGTHQLHKITDWWTPFLACVPGLLLSIPANLVNYSPIQTDYMYFRGQHSLAKMVFGETAHPLSVTMKMYAIYVLAPIAFYWIPVAAAAGLNRMKTRMGKK